MFRSSPGMSFLFFLQVMQQRLKVQVGNLKFLMLSLLFTIFFLSRKREFTKKEKRSRKSARKMKYADFFDPPDGELDANLGSGGESEKDDENESDEEEEFDKDAEKEVEDGHVTASSEDQDDSDSEKKSKAISNFEKKQQKVIFFLPLTFLIFFLLACSGSLFLLGYTSTAFRIHFVTGCFLNKYIPLCPLFLGH